LEIFACVKGGGERGGAMRSCQACEILWNERVRSAMRKVKATDVARDVHGGMGDTLLMEKYHLSSKQLEGVLRKLVDADLITHMQLYERTSLSDNRITRAFIEADKAVKELD